MENGDTCNFQNCPSKIATSHKEKYNNSKMRFMTAYLQFKKDNIIFFPRQKKGNLQLLAKQLEHYPNLVYRPISDEKKNLRLKLQLV